MGRQGHVHTARVPADGHDRPVAAWLAATFPHSDLATWTARIAAGEVEVGGRPVEPEHRLRRGSEVVWRRPAWDEPDVPRDWVALHEDADLVAVHKPAGLPTMPAGGFHEHTLLHLVRERWPGADPMHRLGRGTSGVVLFARHAAAASSLQAAWRERRVDKHYLALVSGDPTWDTRTITTPIGRVPHPRLGDVYAARADGLASRSHAAVRIRQGDRTVLSVQIETGRPHQIRIHAASVGHPLVGDPLYGDGGLPRSDALPGDLGYLLHAWRLTVPHPGGGDLTIEAPPPPELA